MFENRVLSRVFGPKRDEVTGEWRNVHKEVLRDFYSLPNIVRVVKIEKNKIGGAWCAYGRGERFAQVSSGETRGKEATGETRCRWKNYIKMDFQEVGGDGDWMESA